MICPICEQKVHAIKTIIRARQTVTGCNGCLQSNLLQSHEGAHAHNKQWQQRQYAADIIQPWEADYAKVRGIDKAREAGWSEERLRSNL